MMLRRESKSILVKLKKEAQKKGEKILLTMPSCRSLTVRRDFNPGSFGLSNPCKSFQYFHLHHANTILCKHLIMTKQEREGEREREKPLSSLPYHECQYPGSDQDHEA